MNDFLRRLKQDAELQDSRKVLEAVAATPPTPANPGMRAPDDDNDNDAAEIQRLVDAQQLVRAVDSEKPDARLKQADQLLSRAIEQERKEDADGA